ncbi:MAG TPA: hypothetical protein GX391_02225 [Firmicutes bacterium]|jgi:hypothetical protein|nr:hypothetical protein [Bacillota bacterium]HOQ23657.1 hypothetical protein [Bacillota bacterium]HPT67073.1 hypothetical protein [Bacillota bacterium]
MKGVFWKEGEPFNNSMSLIVSLMVRYPEIATLSLDPQEKTLHFTFLIGHELAEAEFRLFLQDYTMSLEVLAELNQRNYSIASISYYTQDNFSFLEVVRDISSLSQEEISLIVHLVREKLGELVCDPEDVVGEEEQVFQEELIEHMLEDLKDSRQEKKLIGIREEGRVMIFNR